MKIVALDSKTICYYFYEISLSPLRALLWITAAVENRWQPARWGRGGGAALWERPLLQRFDSVWSTLCSTRKELFKARYRHRHKFSLAQGLRPLYCPVLSVCACLCGGRLVRLALLPLSHIHSLLCGNTGLFTILPGLDRLVISLIPWKARKCQTEELLISPREKGKKIKRQSCGEYSWQRKGGGGGDGGPRVLSEDLYPGKWLITVLSTQHESSNVAGKLKESTSLQENRNTRRICAKLYSNVHKKLFLFG